MPHGESPSIEIRHGRLGRSVYASRSIPAGEVILRGRGVPAPGRTRHTFQIDHDAHVVLSGPIELINHSCEPNCGVLVLRDEGVVEIHALRDLSPGEELRTDYATFEAEIEFMDGPCLCGAPGCRGRISGFKDLPEEVREAYGIYIAEYLRELEVPAGA